MSEIDCKPMYGIGLTRPVHLISRLDVKTLYENSLLKTYTTIIDSEILNALLGQIRGLQQKLFEQKDKHDQRILDLEAEIIALEMENCDLKSQIEDIQVAKQRSDINIGEQVTRLNSTNPWMWLS